MADALEYAHRRGVIHRDIKPENILLHNGRPMVADFGVALALRIGDGNRLTDPGITLGTPAYMSPEQAAGDHDLDARSDVYSLACVTYELLTGEPPCVGRSAQAVIAKHIVDPVPSARRLRAGVPPGLDAALERALAKVPADRYPTVAAFAEVVSADDQNAGAGRSRSVAVLPFVTIGGAVSGAGLRPAAAEPTTCKSDRSTDPRS